MLHRFYVGTRETGIVGMQIYGENKKEAVARLIKMTGGEIPFVYFNSPGHGTDIVSDVLHGTDSDLLHSESILDLEPSPEAYICEQAMKQDSQTIEEAL